MSETISVPMTAQRDIQTVTTEIRTLHRQAQGMILNYAIEIGRRLKEAKSLLEHGEWGEWLENEVDFSRSTANNFMKIFEEYGTKQVSLFGDANSQTLGNLPYTHALKLLAVPAEEREEFVEEHHVEDLSSRELDRLIKERDAAVRRAEESEERELAQADALAELEALRNKVETQEQMAGEGRAALHQMEEKVAAAQERLDKEKKKAKEREDQLRRELEETRNNPEVPEEVLQKLRAELEEARKNPHVPEEVLQKIRAEVEEASSASVEKAKREAQEALEALAQARKDLTLADGDMAVFKELFRRVQEDFELMTDAIRRIRGKDPESAKKLQNAVQALVKQWAA